MSSNGELLDQYALHHRKSRAAKLDTRPGLIWRLLDAPEGVHAKETARFLRETEGRDERHIRGLAAELAGFIPVPKPRKIKNVSPVDRDLAMSERSMVESELWAAATSDYRMHAREMVGVPRGSLELSARQARNILLATVFIDLRNDRSQRWPQGPLPPGPDDAEKVTSAAADVMLGRISLGLEVELTAADARPNIAWNVGFQEHAIRAGAAWHRLVEAVSQGLISPVETGKFMDRVSFAVVELGTGGGKYLGGQAARVFDAVAAEPFRSLSLHDVSPELDRAVGAVRLALIGGSQGFRPLMDRAAAVVAAQTVLDGYRTDGLTHHLMTTQKREQVADHPFEGLG